MQLKNHFKNKQLFILILFSLFSFSANALSVTNKCVPKSKQYVYYVTTYDWGASVDSVVMNTGKKYKAEQINPKDFEVTVAMMSANGNSARFGLNKGERLVTDAFLSDEYGNKVSEESSYITITLETGPEVEYVSPFSKSIVKNINDFYGYKIENDELDFTLYELAGIVNEPASKFKTGRFVDDDMTLSYAYYDTPEKAEGTPLFIWLHGITEFGSNPYVPLMEMKTSNLASEEIQKYFDKGLEILVPQCPTSWLETTSLDSNGNRIWAPVDIEGTVNKVLNPVYSVLNLFTNVPDTRNSGEKIGTTSYYTTYLMDLIEAFLESHKYIDLNKIYIGGCSAGGYMTMNMLIEYPEYFAAAIPTCEVYLDSKITDAKIETIKNTPIWFVQAETDTTVKPAKNCVPTKERLINAGAKDVRLSLYPGVFDQTGYEYSGHLVWYYTLNNDPTIDNVTVFEWLSRQSK